MENPVFGTSGFVEINEYHYPGHRPAQVIIFFLPNATAGPVWAGYVTPFNSCLGLAYYVTKLGFFPLSVEFVHRAPARPQHCAELLREKLP